jgi:toxin YoeB
MTLTFSTKAWDEYLYWQTTDKNILKRINLLIKEIPMKELENLNH